MKILQVITKRQLRGAEIFFFFFSREFTRAGHQVMIVALQSPNSFPDLNQIELVEFNLKKSDRFKAFSAWKKFSEIVNTWKPDVIQANASETLKFTVLSKLLFHWKTPLVYRNANKASDFIRSSYSRIWNKWLASKLDFVISVSENCRIDFVKTFHIPQSKAKTIPIGTNIPRDENADLYMDPPSAFPYYINVASLVPEKNHAGLLSIYKRYRETGGTISLTIVGDGNEKEKLIELSNVLGISDCVYFLGYRNDATRLMQKSQALLLPSFIEGIPGVILEAMATKIPVIAYDVGGISEVIKDGKTGALINKGNEVHFVNWMNRLETDQELKKKIVNAAFSACQDHYSIDVIADRFLKQYASLQNAKS